MNSTWFSAHACMHLPIVERYVYEREPMSWRSKTSASRPRSIAGRRLARGAVERIRGQTGERVLARGDVLAGEFGAVEAVLGGEQRDELDARRAVQQHAVEFARRRRCRSGW